MIKAAKSEFFDKLDPSTPKAFWKTAKYLTKQDLYSSPKGF